MRSWIGVSMLVVLFAVMLRMMESVVGWEAALEGLGFGVAVSLWTAVAARLLFYIPADRRRTK